MRNKAGDRDPRTSGDQHLGRAIRGLRRSQSLTLTALSEYSGLSVPFLSQVENNRANPSLQSLSAIAKALGCNVIDIISSAQADSIVDIERAGSPAHATDRSLHRQGGQVHITELSRPAGEGQDWQCHVHDVVLYVVRGDVIMSTSTTTEQHHHVLHTGDRAFCGVGVSYRWHAESDNSVVLTIRLDDRAAPPHL
jgi:transcriptional regulator with XRE-family HTH domain